MVSNCTRLEIILFFSVRKDNDATDRGKNLVFSHNWIRNPGNVLLVCFFWKKKKVKF